MPRGGDREEFVHVDRHGSAIASVRFDRVAAEAMVVVGGRTLKRARTFSEVSLGVGFWYENANGLVEIAVNEGRAWDSLDLPMGARIGFTTE